MRSWFCLALFAMLWPFGLPALTAADGPGSLASIRATYRRPAAIPFPSSNPYSKAKFVLGEMLLFDPLLSGSRTRSCATCDSPSLSWSDVLPTAIGDDAKVKDFRSPTLIEVAFITYVVWE